MSSREQIDLQAMPLEGQLHDPATLPRLYTFLSRGEWSGMVSVRAGDIERRIYFADGRISTAGSNDPADSLASHLIRAGLLSEEDRSKAAGQLRTTDRGWSFGRQLVKLGLVEEPALARSERRRVLSIALATLGLRSGQHACVSGAVAGDAMPNQAIEVPRVVAEGVLSTWDAASALEVLGGRDAVLDIITEHLSDYEATGAAEEYDMTLLRCNGSRTVDEVVALSPLPEAVALRFLAAARLVSCISSVPGAPRTAEPDDAPRYDPEATLPPDEAALLRSSNGAPPFLPDDVQADDAPIRATPPEAMPEAGAGGRMAPEGSAAVVESTGRPGSAIPASPWRRWIIVLVTVAILAGAGYVAWRGWLEVQSSTDSR
jgi:hypothetical protein